MTFTAEHSVYAEKTATKVTKQRIHGEFHKKYLFHYLSYYLINMFILCTGVYIRGDLLKIENFQQLINKHTDWKNTCFRQLFSIFIKFSHTTRCKTCLPLMIKNPLFYSSNAQYFITPWTRGITYQFPHLFIFTSKMYLPCYLSCGITMVTVSNRPIPSTRACYKIMTNVIA